MIDSEEGGNKHNNRRAIVFIHGVGVQDRFQQLSQFTDGLVNVSSGANGLRGRRWARRRDAGAPLGAYVPLTITGPSENDAALVDVYEVYWSPLFNGLSKWNKVVLWALLTLWRSNPINNKLRFTRGKADYKEGRKKQVAPPAQNPEADVLNGNGSDKFGCKEKRERGPRWKFAYELFFFSIMIVFALFLLWMGLSAMVLASDQSAWGRTHVQASYEQRRAYAQNFILSLKPESVKEMLDLKAQPLVSFGSIPLVENPVKQWTADELAAELLVVPPNESEIAESFLPPGPPNPSSGIVSLAAVEALKKGELAHHIRLHEKGLAPRERWRAIVLDVDYARQGRMDPALQPLLPEPARTLGIELAQGKKEVFNWNVFSKFWSAALGYLCFRERHDYPVFVSEIKSLGQEAMTLSIFDVILGGTWLFSFVWFIRKLGGIVRRIVIGNRSDSQDAGASVLGLCFVDLLTALALVGVMLLLHRFLDYSTEHLLCALALLKGVQALLKWAMESILADCQIYFTRNENSALYAAREAVLVRTREVLEPIAATYQDVVIVGHSLGSVIGLDALRRLYTNACSGDAHSTRIFDKISSFVTIGSPLEKSRLFFASKDFKTRYVEFSSAVDRQIFMADPVTRPDTSPAEQIVWFNFWTTFDIVSNALISFPLCGEHELRLRQRWSFWPHSNYWIDPVCVQHMLEIFATDKEKLPSVNLTGPYPPAEDKQSSDAKSSDVHSPPEGGST